MTQKQLDYLYSQPWFPEFLVNVFKQGNEDILIEHKKSNNPVYLIDGTITWINTPEGIWYWRDINEKWQKFLRDEEIKEVTLEEIAKKFEVPVEKLRIKD